MSLFARLAVAALLCGGVAVAAHAETRTYAMDPNHTDIVVTWTHFGYSHPSAMFNHITGTITYDPNDPSKDSVEATIPISSVHTASPALDEHLQGSDFFDASKYPDVIFKSTKVTRGDGPDKLKVMGNLTVHGKTAPVTLDVTVNKAGINRGKHQVAFNATTTLKRSDFGVDLYAPTVSDEVTLIMTTEATATEPDPEAPEPKGK
ncbi:MAG TPA: YceI family protein [Rhodanobacteraceae bacterium]|nr:YceI family protein [Rhodanobacteraceae bacterium]